MVRQNGEYVMIFVKSNSDLEIILSVQIAIDFKEKLQHIHDEKTRLIFLYMWKNT